MLNVLPTIKTEQQRLKQKPFLPVTAEGPAWADRAQVESAWRCCLTTGGKLWL